LDLSKIEAGKTNLYLEHFLVAELINEVVIGTQNLVEQKGNQLQVSLAPDLGYMYGDMVKLRQILLNLLSNASKFTHHGRVTITAEREKATPQDLLIITVQDTGIGMTPEEMGRIFSAFTQADASTTRQYGGTGLGLTISHRFCELMGGNIQVESTPNVGSTFTVTLPTVITLPDDTRPPMPSTAADNSAAAVTTTIVRPALQRGIILVISPREDHRDEMVRWLLAKHYRTYAAPDGYRGLKLAKRLRPHAIVLQATLPDYNYVEFAAALRDDAHLRHTPLLLYGLDVDAGEEAEALQAAESDPRLSLVQRTEESLSKKIQEIMRLTKPAGAGLAAKHKHRVLVVEDNFALRDILRLTLQKRGFDVIEAIDGLMAIEFLQTTSLLPDVILLDLMMPRLDGFAFVAQIRAMPRTTAVPIIAITARPLDPHEQERLREQVDEILYKGLYSQNDLLRRIDQLILHHTIPATA
jgi:CheY-like chemotaxis protein/two-component sensor histidine kinase